MSTPPTPPPTILLSDVRSRNTEKSCYVTLGPKVYDVTDFLEDHPGGGELILEYGGKAIEEILKDDISHYHSEAAYHMLDELFIGYVADEKTIDAAVASNTPDDIVPLPPNANGKAELKAVNGSANGHLTNGNGNGKANGTTNGSTTTTATANGKPVVFAATGMSTAEDLSRETDYSADYTQHKFLDLNKPLLMQVFNGGFSKEFYLEQVHRPRHYRGGASAPLFGNFLEPLSLTPWWVVPLVWLPPVIGGTIVAASELGLATVGYWVFGVCFWTIVEYTLHRFLFHIDDIMPDNRFCITLHFLLHGIHHYLPMDRYRLVMPPTLFVVLAAPFWKLAHAVFFYTWHGALAAYCGGVFGYICYDLTHYFLHHRKLPSYYQQLKKYHLQHHFADYQNGFGVTSRFWDRVFGTELQIPPPKVVKTT